MCDPATASFVVGAGSQVLKHQAEGSAVETANRAKLKNYAIANDQWRSDIILDQAEWKNDVSLYEIDQDRVYQAMVDQWTEQDQQLDQLFAKGDQEIEQAMIKMYESEYAGTGTGVTAARLAGQSARKLGQETSNKLSQMMLSEEAIQTRKEAATSKARYDSQQLYEKIRFTPVHGPRPEAPELQAKPGLGGLILGIAGAGVDAWGVKQATSASKFLTGKEELVDTALSGSKKASRNLNIAEIGKYMDIQDSSGDQI